MIYEYKCNSCKLVFTIERSMQENIPAFMPCTKCGGTADRLWGNSTIKIPDTFKAADDLCNSDTGSNFDYIKNRMKHGVRPSGKSKVYY